jgi:hypothetical protein
MKKNRRRRGPSRASLAAIPQIDMSRYRARRNPFARRVRAEGIQLLVPAWKLRAAESRPPSRASLREIPEPDLSRAKRNPYSERVRRSGGIVLQVGRGRPKKGEEVGTTVPRSVRFPEKTWKDLERCARKQGISLHAALRLAVLSWLKAS